MSEAVSVYMVHSACHTLFDGKLTLRDIPSLDDSVIKAAFRKKAKQYHPDLSKITSLNEEWLTNKFRKIYESYNILMLYSKSFIRRHRPFSACRPVKKARDRRMYTHSRRAPNDHYYKGRLPGRQLRFAEYLYYSGKISWRTLICAIVAQKRTRPVLGRLFQIMNYLSRDENFHIIRNSKIGEKFGQTAIRLGYINTVKLKHALHKQKQYNRPIGRYFIEQNILDYKDLTAAVFAQARHNIMFKTIR